MKVCNMNKGNYMLARREVPLFSAKAVNANIDFASTIKAVLDRHWYILGEELKRFEEEFASYIGAGSCVGVANGSDALEIALRALGVQKHDKVVTVANAGFYGSTAIYSVGANPLYIDIDQKSLLMSAARLEAIIEQKPAAIIVTHLYGLMADIEDIVKIASVNNIPVIEDCAQAHGAIRQGKRAGSFGDIGCFSFYPTKNLGALGDGGAIVTSDKVLADKVRKLRQYGWSTKYEVALQNGRNSRLDEIQAAILREKLPFLDSCNEQRRAIAQQYNEAFASLDIQLPCSVNKDYVAHLYVVRAKQRSELSSFLRERGISSDVHYPIPDHHQPAYRSSNPISLPNTENACKTVLSLPCFPGLTQMEVNRVIDAVKAYFQR